VRACVVAQGQILGKNDFPELGKDEIIKTHKDETAEVFTPPEPGKLFTLDEVEERYIRKVIKENDKKNKGEICEILGISRPTFERKLEKYGITFERE
jgi:two-component system, NtrC family, response regulator AtoC